MLRFLFAGLLLCSSILAAKDKRDDAIALVQQGAELWTLDSLPDPTYRLKIKVVLKELQTGDLTGIYLKQRSKDQMRVETVIGPYRSIYIQDGSKAWQYRSTDVPLRVMEALRSRLRVKS
jgi:hypothetical protein